MNIRLVNITRDPTHIEDIKRLYLTAFPEDERAPFDKLVRKAKRKDINFFACMDGGKWIGMLYILNYKDLSYIFYLAVDERSRGRGYGTAILKAALKKYQGRRFFLAIEQPDERADNFKQRLARQHFYENAGFERTGQRIQEANVIYDMLGVGGRVQPSEYRSLIWGFAGLMMLKYTMKLYDS